MQNCFFTIVFRVVIIGIIFFMYGCNQNNKPRTTKKEFQLEKIARLEFRRSYADAHTRELSKKEYDALFEVNPNIGTITGIDSLVLKKFQDIGFVKNDELLLKKLNFCNIDTTLNVINDMDTVRLNFLLDYQKSDGLGLRINNSLRFDFDISFMNKPSFKMIDIINGGFDELVVLEEYYVMNGDNWVFNVYKIN